MRVQKVQAKQIQVGMVINAYWEEGRYTTVRGGEVVDIHPLKQGGRDIRTKGGSVREYFDDEPVEVAQ